VVLRGEMWFLTLQLEPLEPIAQTYHVASVQFVAKTKVEMYISLASPHFILILPVLSVALLMRMEHEKCQFGCLLLLEVITIN